MDQFEWLTVEQLRDAVAGTLEAVADRRRGEQTDDRTEWTRQVFVGIKDRLPK